MKLSRLQSKINVLYEDDEPNFSHETAVKAIKRTVDRLAKNGIVLPESDIYKISGDGSYARVYDFGDKVVKITNDISDYKAWLKIAKVNHPNLPYVYDAFDTGFKYHTGIPLYIIVQENVNQDVPDEFSNVVDFLDSTQRHGYSDEISPLTASTSDMVETLNAFGLEDEETVEKYIEKMKKLQSILRSIKTHTGIEPTDIHLYNWGRRGNTPIILDLGGAKI